MDIHKRLSEVEVQSLEQINQKVSAFCKGFKGQEIIFLTSGGTSVPLQERTVRFIENFSTGTRGSLLAEQILESGKALIFFYRDRTYIPFIQGLTTTSIALQEGDFKLQKLIEGKQKLRKHADRLLLIPYFSIYFYLEGIVKIKCLLPPKSIIILCSAVSDFIPSEVVTHKIHTTNQLKLELTSSPKILGQMVSKQHLCASFKLETDGNKLDERMATSLNRYKIDIIIGNVLGNKNWIKVKFNQDIMGPHEDIEYDVDVQKSILKAVLLGWQYKFSKQ